MERSGVQIRFFSFERLSILTYTLDFLVQYNNLLQEAILRCGSQNNRAVTQLQWNRKCLLLRCFINQLSENKEIKGRMGLKQVTAQCPKIQLHCSCVKVMILSTFPYLENSCKTKMLTILLTIQYCSNFLPCCTVHYLQPIQEVIICLLIWNCFYSF